jgi:hypothetical protein
MKTMFITISMMLTIHFMAAQVTITDAGLQGNQDYHWTSDKEYLLDGLVFLEAGGTLTIDAGTVIRGKEVPSNGNDNTSALVIARGAQIEATGTSENPILFTAESDNLQGNLLPSDCGQWGGLIILGKAPAHADGKSELAIEGIPSGDSRGLFGGNEPTDNSGTLQYVSIRHTGVGLLPGSEIQGLTLGGVGSNTTIEYVEAYASCDDGVEIFGGTVDLRHFVVAFATDDSYDFDLGWRGTGQYLFALQLSGTGEAYDKVGEWDGASPDDAPLYSKPHLSNVTFIGPGQNSTGAQNAIVMRDAWGGTLYNSILVDFPGVGIEVEDLESGIDAYGRLDSNIVISSNTWAQFGSASTADELVKISGGNPTEPNASTLKAHLSDHNNLVEPGNVLAGIGRMPGSTSLDPRPVSGYANAATVPAVLDQTTYRGAFDPAGTNWLEGWTALAAYNYLADVLGVSTTEPIGYAMDHLSPNPASATAHTKVTLPEPARLAFEIRDLSGRLIYSNATKMLPAGTHSFQLDVRNWHSGIYLVTMQIQKGLITRKLMVK